MNQKELITIDDDSLDQVAGGGFGLLGCLIAKPLQIVGGLLDVLFAGCAPRRKGC